MFIQLIRGNQVEVPEEEADEVRHLVRRVATTAAKLRVPLDVDIK